MSRSREELESLDRDTLIREAEEVGVKRARIMTRPELVDEIILARAQDRASVKIARGFFGMARDLLSRAVERGLNLPDAAERFRGAPFEPRARTSGEAIPTVTLAEIYASQGHTQKAIATLRGVLTREPDHAAAHALLEKLEDESYEAPPPPNLVNEDLAEEQREQEDEEVEEGEEKPEEEREERASPSATEEHEDACIALPSDDGTMRVAWRLRERTLAHHRGRTKQGRLALRVVVITPNSDTPHRTTRDVEVTGAAGEYLVSGLPPSVVVRIAVGWKDDLQFAPMAHSPAIEADGGNLEDLFVWTPTGPESIPEDLASIIAF